METVINGRTVEIKSGDIIVLDDEHSGIFIDGETPKVVYTNFRGANWNGWDTYYNVCGRIELIFRWEPNSYNAFNNKTTVKGYLLKTENGIIVYEKSNIVELTMYEIARKFGVDVNNLKIKK